jgi:uncharacterized membrane protein
MKNNQQELESFLVALGRTLYGQPPSLIQDALYDAENHILDALAEAKGEGFDNIVAAYGSPEEVAQQYVQLEAQTQQFLVGKRTQHKANGFFAPLCQLSSYKALGYFAIAFPVSVMYFAWFALVGINVFVLSITLVGLPVLALFFKLQSYLALIEGQLVNTLLGERMPRRPHIFVSGRQAIGFYQQIVTHLKSPIGWKVTLYTLVHLPIASIYFAACVCMFFGSIAVVISPIVDPILHYFFPTSSIDIAWYWMPLCILVGVIGVTLSLHVAGALSKLHRAIARSLLVN